MLSVPHKAVVVGVSHTDCVARGLHSIESAQRDQSGPSKEAGSQPALLDVLLIFYGHTSRMIIVITGL